MPRYFGLIPAAGSGSRMAADRPKQYLPLLGRNVLYWACAAVLADRRVERVLLVLAPEDVWFEPRDYAEFGPRLQVERCGGATRAASVRAGLLALAGELTATDWVLVHDAARPCLSAAALERLLVEVGEDAAGGLLALPVAETVKRAGTETRVEHTVSRAGLWLAQTPQMFRFGLLQRGLNLAPDSTDEAAAVEALGHRPLLVRGEASNLKITWPEDLSMAALYLQAQRG
jgi:2-C-methyl-D-erythritol 4-phosphate cytidylyltransferase